MHINLEKKSCITFTIKQLCIGDPAVLMTQPIPMGNLVKQWDRLAVNTNSREICLKQCKRNRATSDNCRELESDTI